MLACLLEPSPPLGEDDFARLRDTQTRVAEFGRDPELTITSGMGHECPVSRCGLELIEWLEPLAVYMDQHGDAGYCQSLSHYRLAFEDPDNTPSAKVLRHMREHNNAFFTFAMAQAESHENYFKNRPLDPSEDTLLRREAADSHQSAQQAEQDDTLDFESFLDNYFSQ
jgi:glutamate--cysteine ligase